MRLDDITIVLARPSGPGNTGAVCRAMKNMGLSRLAIAGPASGLTVAAPTRPLHEGGDLFEGPEMEQLLARAVHAGDIWERAARFPRLDAALAGCAVSVGTTRRRGRNRKSSSMSPRELAAFLKDRAGTAAIVFGNERAGLDDKELSLCGLASHIPVDAAFPSLNLSHAVQIYAYEFFLAMGDAAACEVPGRWVPMTQAESAALAGRVCASLESLGFYRNPGREEQERFLRDLFSRAGLGLKEGRYLGNIVSKAARLARYP